MFVEQNPANFAGCFLSWILGVWYLSLAGSRCRMSLVVIHVLGKDESHVRFLLRAPEFFIFLSFLDFFLCVVNIYVNTRCCKWIWRVWINYMI